MSVLEHIFNTIKHYKEKLLRDFVATFFSEKTYLKFFFRRSVGYSLNIDNPQTYNEKLQWLKINDQHPEFTQMVDKVESKGFVANIIGNKYIIPTLAVWDNIEDIDWNALPNQFVIKVTSDSGGIVVCKDKSSLDIKAAKRKLKKGWGRNYYKYNREYPYRNLIPRIIAEQYMEDEYGELRDYKIFCFNGEPRLLFVASDRQKKGDETKFDFFDTEWNHLPFTNGHPNSSHLPEKPDNFEEMLEIARKLAENINTPQVRIDLYNSKGQIYFGEITFFHWSGMKPFVPEEWDYKLGEMIRLPFEK